MNAVLRYVCLISLIILIQGCVDLHSINYSKATVKSGTEDSGWSSRAGEIFKHEIVSYGIDVHNSRRSYYMLFPIPHANIPADAPIDDDKTGSTLAITVKLEAHVDGLVFDPYKVVYWWDNNNVVSTSKASYARRCQTVRPPQEAEGGSLIKPVRLRKNIAMCMDLEFHNVERTSLKSIFSMQIRGIANKSVPINLPVMSFNPAHKFY